jgi:DNA polymerase III subunit epsilon
MDFVAIDFETANHSFDSICQIGVVVFVEGCVAETWETLVDPQDYFDGWNVSIHGIEERHVVGAPKFPDVFQRLCGLLAGQIVVHHTPFDKVALAQAFEKHQLLEVSCQWLDTARVVRRAWPEFSQRGYGLKNVAKTLGIDFKHHSAQEDARASGEILIQAIRQTGLGITDWLTRASRPIGTSANYPSGTCARDGNPEGQLFGETVVFTGTLSLPKRQMADLAASVGCNVTDGVNAATTLLVVGNQDMGRLAGHEQSSKHRKAETLRAKGKPIRILTEADFERLINSISEVATN